MNIRTGLIVALWFIIQIKFFLVTFFECGIPFFWPAIVHTAIFLLFMFSLACLLKGKRSLYYLLIVNILCTVLLNIDWIYSLAFNGMFPGVSALKSSKEMLGWMSSVEPMLRSTMFALYIDIVVIAVVIYRYTAAKTIRCSMRNFGVVLAVMLCFVILAYFSYAKDFYSLDQYQPGIKSTQKMKVFGVIGYPIIEYISTLRNESGQPLTAQEQTQLAAWHDWNDEKLPHNKYFGLFKGKNLIVMQVESLESFQMFQSVYGQEITPNLNKIVKKYWYFSEFRAQEFNSSTADGELAANVSCFPFADTAFEAYPKNKYNAFPRIFEAMGYATYSLHGDNATTWNWPDGERGMGYQKIEYSRDFKDVNLIYANGSIPDAEFLPQVVDRIAGLKKPFETYVETGFSHIPFDLPDSDKQLKLPGKLDNSGLGRYFQMFRYVDTALGKYIAELDKRGVFKDTVLIMYGDHPSIHKYYDVKTFSCEGNWWQDNAHRVPFIIITDGIEPMQNKTFGGQVDILPTMCYLFGINYDKYAASVFGRVLLNTKRNFTIVPGDSTMYGTYTDYDKQMMLKALDLSDLSLRKAAWGKW